MLFLPISSLDGKSWRWSLASSLLTMSLKTISRLTSFMKWSTKMLFITIVRMRFKGGIVASDFVPPSIERKKQFKKDVIYLPKIDRIELSEV